MEVSWKFLCDLPTKTRYMSVSTGQYPWCGMSVYVRPVDGLIQGRVEEREDGDTKEDMGLGGVKVVSPYERVQSVIVPDDWGVDLV